MTELDRRAVLRGISSGLLAASVGLPLMPKAAEAMVSSPGALGQSGADQARPENLVEKIQVVVVHPRRRRRRSRRRVCWWRRGRRVCEWRW